ncbi:lysophospholipid acyltransferase family protein [Pyruvatibacter mobilis]|uniref:lysophospholipid acyltransferase family protein n=1 Tax=Pyruvatibacter mobilis TaxID=1712261 RepID=UPI003BAD79BF
MNMDPQLDRKTAPAVSAGPTAQTAVDFSYASPDDPRLKRVVIRAIELLTGQPRLKRMYFDNRENPVAGETFFAAAIRYLRLQLEFDMARLDAIPKDGPLVVVANHPFGVIDGLVIGHLTSMVRPNFKVLTNAVLTQAPELEDYLLPVDFDPTPEAMATNIRTRKEARDLLNSGGTIIVFPGGTVSTAPRPFGRAVDPIWQPFTAQLIQRSKATVVPMFFDGQNGRLFQVASHFSRTLRLSLLFREVRERIGSRVRIRIGEPIAYDDLAHLKDRVEFSEELRRRTYSLGPGPVPKRTYSGLTMGEKLRARRQRRALARHQISAAD